MKDHDDDGTNDHDNAGDDGVDEKADGDDDEESLEKEKQFPQLEVRRATLNLYQ